MDSRSAVEYHRAVGCRIAEARQLANLPQHQFAAALGVDRAYLRSIEIASGDGSSAPPWLLHRIATVCCVKADFLLGLTAESEPDESGPTYREIAHICNARAAREREDHAREAALLKSRLAEFREMAAVVDAVAREVQANLQRVAELNPDQWPDIAAGAPLAASVAALSDAVGSLGRRSSHYVAQTVVADAPETLLRMESQSKTV